MFVEIIPMDSLDWVTQTQEVLLHGSDHWLIKMFTEYSAVVIILGY
jgi:hypothetical protein